MKGPKLVYFMKPIGMKGPVKVGCSCWPVGRLKALDIWSPFPLEIIASAPGEHQQERDVHWHLRDDRLHGEWFRWSARLAALIRHVTETRALPPLEISPYGKTKKGRGNNPSRRPAWSREKGHLTFRVGSAEQHAFGSRYSAERPQRIRDLIASYQGPFTPPPEAPIVAELEEYIAELLARPKCKTTWQERWEARKRAAESAAA